MNEDPTRDLPQSPRSFEERIFAELAAMRGEFRTELAAVRAEFRTELRALNARLDSLDTRLTSLEDKVDARLRETRPIWEDVQQRLTEIEKALTILNRQFKTLISDTFDLRSRVEKLENEQPAV